MVRRAFRTAAAVAAGLFIGAGPALAAEQAGVAAAVVGDVTIGGKPRPEPVDARSGMKVLRFDRVTTRQEARMQILLLNETTFSVGPKSEVVIDKFVYNPDKGVVDIAAEFVQGVMRYVAGSADKAKSRNVEIETAAGVIGVRGTSVFLHRKGEDGRVFAGLLGPGPGNNAAMRRGGFVAKNEQGRTRIIRPGYGVELRPGMPPSEPVEVPDSVMRVVQRGIQGTPDAQPAGGDAATKKAASQVEKLNVKRASGQTQAAARRESREETDSQKMASMVEEVQTTNAEDTNRERTIEMEDAREQAGGGLPTDIPGFGAFAGLDVTLENTTFASLAWTNADDLDLHVTGPQPNGDGRFHVFDDQPGALNETPFARVIAQAQTGGQAEAAAITQLAEGGPYRVSVFNAGNPAQASTALANQSGAMLTLLQAGAISRGPGGTVQINPDLLRTITPPSGGVGNTWVGAELSKNADAIEVINELTSFPDGSSVR